MDPVTLAAAKRAGLQRSGGRATGPIALHHAATPAYGSLGFGNVPAPHNISEIINDGAHNGFPGLAVTRDGTLTVVYRAAPQHNAATGANRGVLKQIQSDDLGATWGTATTIYDDGTLDSRDPTLALLSNGTLACTFFKSDGTTLTVHVMFNTGSGWSAPTEVDTGLTETAAASGPIVELNDGTLLLAAYGKNTGDTYDSVIVITSDDEGTTWSNPVTVADGESDSKDYQEPFMGLLNDGDVLMLIRQGTTSIYRSLRDADTGTWSAATEEISGGEGRPAWTQLSSGAIICVHRSSNDMVYRTSWDNGATWEDEVTLENPGTTFAYAQITQVTPGIAACAYALEETVNDAPLYLRYFIDGQGVTPLGDARIFDPRLRAATHIDSLIAWDTFTRAALSRSDSGHEWTTLTGAFTISDGKLALPASTVSVAVIDTGEADIVLEAAGLASGWGIVFRAADVDNYLYATIEGSGGQFRLYKRSSGSNTQLAGAAVAPNGDYWHRMRILARSSYVEGYLNGHRVWTHTLTAGDLTTFGSNTKHGARLTLTTQRMDDLTVSLV